MLQTGVPPFRAWSPDPQLKYIYKGRSLAEWVHYDFLYQAYHNAALILLNQSPDTTLNTNPYLNPTNPYKNTKVQTGFATFGAAHICCLLRTACEAALLAAWFQKWLVHRRTRPEEFGGRVHQTASGMARYPIHPDLLNSAALKRSVDYWIDICAPVNTKSVAKTCLDAETGVFMLLYLDLAYDQARAEGRLRDFADLRQVIMVGAAKRLRPKVMTVATTFAGLLPIMWATGTGSDVMKRIAAPMIGGILTSFLLELVVYPAVYEVEVRSRP